MNCSHRRASLVFAAALLAASLAGCAELQGVKQSAGDIAITTKVNTSLDSDTLVKGSKINVSTENGVVTLRGVAVSPQAKIEAVNVTRKIEGVREVRDGIIVGRP
jgi:osmotically-inducible protein OsmY